MNLREQIVAEAESWLGTPYQHGGKVRGREGAVDCLMLAVAVYQAVGLVPEDFEPRPYAFEWFLHHSEELYLQGLEQYAHRVECGEPGDMAMFQMGRTVAHGAIVVGEDLIVHAYRPARCVTVTDLHHLHHRLHSFWSVIP